MVLLFDGVEEMDHWYHQIEDAKRTLGRSSVRSLEIQLYTQCVALIGSADEEELEVDAHIHHLEGLISDVPEMSPFVKQRIRSLTNNEQDGTLGCAASPGTASPHRVRNEQFQIGEWMENRVLVTSILSKNTIGYSGGKKSLKTKNRSVFGMSLEEIYSVTSIPIPIVLAQCIYYLKTYGGLKVEVCEIEN